MCIRDRGIPGGTIESVSMVPPFDRLSYSLEGDREDSFERSFKPPPGVIGLIESHARPLLWPSIGFLLGATFLTALSGITAFLLTGFCAFLVHRAKRSEKGLCVPEKSIVIVFLLLLGYVLGSLRGCLWDREMAIAHTLVGTHDAIAVEVISVPQVGPGRVEFFAEIQHVSGAGLSDQEIGLKAKVCLYGDPEDPILGMAEYGQAVSYTHLSARRYSIHSPIVPTGPPRERTRRKLSP